MVDVDSFSEFAPHPTPTLRQGKAPTEEKEHGVRTAEEERAHGQAKVFGAKQEEKEKDPAKVNAKGEKGKEAVACMGPTSWEAGEAIAHGEEKTGKEMGREIGEVTGEEMEWALLAQGREVYQR